jgi:hypothetical protein
MVATLFLPFLTALAPAPTAVDPYAIYARAEAFWTTQPYAPYLTYDVAVSVNQNGQLRVERYHTLFDATTAQGAIRVDEVSDYERAHPVVPHGLNVCILVTCVSKPLPPIDFIGIPVLAPTYSFGMAPFIQVPPPDREKSPAELVREIRREFPSSHATSHANLPPASGGGLRTIAHAAVNATQPYIISYVGEESVDGHQCYHLTLQPRADPGRYRLRDLWVDEQSAASWRLRIALNFIDGPGTTTPWTVDFDNIGGVQYIARESAEHALQYEGQVYQEAAVSFEAIQSVDGFSTFDSFNSTSEVSGGSMREPAW